MWSANFEDGQTISSKEVYWTDIIRMYGNTHKRMTGLWLQHPSIHDLRTYLSGMDGYLYYTEAVTFRGLGTLPVLQQTRIEAEVIVGILVQPDNKVIERRIDYATGKVLESTYSLKEFRFSRDLIFRGKRN